MNLAKDFTVKFLDQLLQLELVKIFDFPKPTKGLINKLLVARSIYLHDISQKGKS
jgi:hypothetical protein